MKKLISKFVLWIMGWKVMGEIPRISKYVIVAAPHTSNWDFVIGRAFGYLLGIEAKFLGKSQLFKFPYGWLFRIMGGIPVDRTKHNSLVDFTIDLFHNSEALVLGLAPEGTRKSVSKWKHGFYYIALGAKVPIVLAFMDYKKKQAGIGKIIYPSGNIKEDFELIETFYQSITPRYPHHYNPKIF